MRYSSDTITSPAEWHHGWRICLCDRWFWCTVLCSTFQMGEVLNTLCTGCERSAVMFPVCFLTLYWYRSWEWGRSTLISLYLSFLVTNPSQTMMEVIIVMDWTDWMKVRRRWSAAPGAGQTSWAVSGGTTSTAPSYEHLLSTRFTSDPGKLRLPETRKCPQ